MFNMDLSIFTGALLFILQSALLAAEDGFTRLPVEKAVLRDRSVDWYGIYTVGEKLGYARLETGPGERDGKPTFIERMEMQLMVKDDDVVKSSTIYNLEEFLAVPPWTLLRLECKETEDDDTKQVSMTFQHSKHHAVLKAGGKKVEREILNLDYDLRDALTDIHWIRSKPKVGDQIIYRSLDSDGLRVNGETLRVSAVRQGKADGVKLTYYQVDFANLKEGLFGSDLGSYGILAILRKVKLEVIKVRNRDNNRKL